MLRAQTLLQNKFQRLRQKESLENCDSVEEYVNKIISTEDKLTNIGFVVSDEWLGTLVIAGLTDHYRAMIMRLESSGIAIISDAIKVKLLQEVKVGPDSSNKNGVLRKPRRKEEV